MQHRPHVYLDMDGVQADFFTAWAQAMGKNRYKELGDRAARETSIDDLNRRGSDWVQEFFSTLPVLPGGQKLVQWLKTHGIPFTVLSAPLRGNEQASISGKISWLDRHNPGTSDRAIFSRDKSRFAVSSGLPNVLIDDFKKYVNEWDSAGGIALLYREHSVDTVISRLKDIYER